VELNIHLLSSTNNITHGNNIPSSITIEVKFEDNLGLAGREIQTGYPAYTGIVVQR